MTLEHISFKHPDKANNEVVILPHMMWLACVQLKMHEFFPQNLAVNSIMQKSKPPIFPEKAKQILRC